MQVIWDLLSFGPYNASWWCKSVRLACIFALTIPTFMFHRMLMQRRLWSDTLSWPVCIVSDLSGIERRHLSGIENTNGYGFGCYTFPRSTLVGCNVMYLSGEENTYIQKTKTKLYTHICSTYYVPCGLCVRIDWLGLSPSHVWCFGLYT